MKTPTVEQLLKCVQELETYFHSYPNTEHEKELASIKQSLVDKTYRIAIVANMSAGKSTFINALFGEHILPAYNEATTDCATYIHSEANITKKAIITFEDGKTLELRENTIKDEIKKYSKKDSEVDDNKYHNVKKIDLYYPFKRIQNSKDSKQKDYKIIFIDTPGPNNTGDFAEKHRSQTRQTLREIDMALFIFDYGQLEGNLQDNDPQGLWNTIKERKAKDKEGFEVFFIINKVDMIFNSSDHFEKGDEHKQWNLAMEKKKQTIEKLKDTASKHGIEDAKIFCVASQYGLFHRMGAENLSDTARVNLDTFLKSHPDKERKPMMELMGIETIEDAINGYIENEVGRRLIDKIQKDLIRLVKKEWIATQKDIAKEPAKKIEDSATTPKSAEFFSKLTRTMHQRSEAILQTALDAITTIKEPRNFTNQEIEDITLSAMIFTLNSIRGASANEIKKALQRLNSAIAREAYKRNGGLIAKDAQTEHNYRNALQHYLKEHTKIFQDKGLLYDIYEKCYIKHTQLLHQAQEQITKHLSQTLGTKIDSIPPQLLDEMPQQKAYGYADISNLPNLWGISKHVSYEQLHKSIERRSHNFEVAKDAYQRRIKELRDTFHQYLANIITHYQHEIQKQDEKLSKVKSAALSQILFDFLLES